jgi:hypothetical protein
VKRNVTVSLDEETARWARVEAARRDISVSAFLAELLEDRMSQTAGYEDAMREFLGRTPRPLKPAGARYPSRDDLHDRAGLR